MRTPRVDLPALERALADYKAAPITAQNLCVAAMPEMIARLRKLEAVAEAARIAMTDDIPGLCDGYVVDTLRGERLHRALAALDDGETAGG